MPAFTFVLSLTCELCLFLSIHLSLTHPRRNDGAARHNGRIHIYPFLQERYILPCFFDILRLAFRRFRTRDRQQHVKSYKSSSLQNIYGYLRALSSRLGMEYIKFRREARTRIIIWKLGVALSRKNARDTISIQGFWRVIFCLVRRCLVDGT